MKQHAVEYVQNSRMYIRALARKVAQLSNEPFYKEIRFQLTQAEIWLLRACVDFSIEKEPEEETEEE